jgi:hypothetical protein
MSRISVARLFAIAGLAGGVIVSASQLPDEPPKQFGSSVTGAYEGWFDNPDGTHTLLAGYLNRNRASEVDIPIGPNNHVDVVGATVPGAGADMGQPTHFLPGRQTGVFAVTVPKEFPPTAKLTWTLTMNGETNVIPFTMKPEYNFSPFKDEAVGNTPPVLHLLSETASGTQGPVGTLAKAVSRTATMAAGLPLAVWGDDDARYTSLTNAPMLRPRAVVTMLWTQYRGAGKVTFDVARPPFKTIAGGQVGQPYKGSATATARFSAPGEYVLLATLNDYSGPGGGGEGCCWTNGLVKVTVTP